jgi:CrcB protein
MKITLTQIGCVAVGGAMGAVSRFVLSELLKRLAPPAFPWGTLTVNLLGCFLIGLAFHLATASRVPHAVSFLLITGFLGAFTTFSTFSLETTELLQDGMTARAGLYVFGSNLLGVGLCLAGLTAGHWLHKLSN